MTVEKTTIEEVRNYFIATRKKGYKQCVETDRVVDFLEKLSYGTVTSPILDNLPGKLLRENSGRYVLLVGLDILKEYSEHGRSVDVDEDRISLVEKKLNFEEKFLIEKLLPSTQSANLSLSFDAAVESYRGFFFKWNAIDETPITIMIPMSDIIYTDDNRTHLRAKKSNNFGCSKMDVPLELCLNKVVSLYKNFVPILPKKRKYSRHI